MSAEEEFIIDGRPVPELKVVELRKELEQRSLPKSGNKKELVDRLLNYLREEQTELRQQRTTQQQEECQQLHQESPEKLISAPGEVPDMVSQYLAQQQIQLEAARRDADKLRASSSTEEGETNQMVQQEDEQQSISTTLIQEVESVEMGDFVPEEPANILEERIESVQYQVAEEVNKEDSQQESVGAKDEDASSLEETSGEEGRRSSSSAESSSKVEERLAAPVSDEDTTPLAEGVSELVGTDEKSREEQTEFLEQKDDEQQIESVHLQENQDLRVENAGEPVEKFKEVVEPIEQLEPVPGNEQVEKRQENDEEAEKLKERSVSNEELVSEGESKEAEEDEEEREEEEEGPEGEEEGDVKPLQKTLSPTSVGSQSLALGEEFQERESDKSAETEDRPPEETSEYSVRLATPAGVISSSEKKTKNEQSSRASSPQPVAAAEQISSTMGAADHPRWADRRRSSAFSGAEFMESSKPPPEQQQQLSELTPDGFARRRAVSPARNPPSRWVHIRGLKRPYTQRALMELLGKFGTVDKDAFWIDSIKSNCIVAFDSAEEAKLARARLHNVVWPMASTDALCVEFSSEEKLKRRKTEDLTPQAGSAAAIPQLSAVAGTGFAGLTIVVDNRHSTSSSGTQVHIQHDKDQRETAVLKRKADELEKSQDALNQIFKKTKAQPSLYYLPLSDVEVAKRYKNAASAAATKKEAHSNSASSSVREREPRGGGGGDNHHHHHRSSHQHITSSSSAYQRNSRGDGGGEIRGGDRRRTTTAAAPSSGSRR